MGSKIILPLKHINRSLLLIELSYFLGDKFSDIEVGEKSLIVTGNFSDADHLVVEDVYKQHDANTDITQVLIEQVTNINNIEDIKSLLIGWLQLGVI